MSGFIKLASTSVTDVRSFLREAADGNGIKYMAEKGKNHHIFFPAIPTSVVDENGNQVTTNQLVAIKLNVHDWKGADGKFNSTICLKDIIRHASDDSNSELLNDGSCPICDRVSAAWDIYNYRKDLEETRCQLVGEERKKHFEGVVKQLMDERKAKAFNTYLYVLVAQFAVKEDGTVVMEDNGLPKYDLKVMKLSASRVEKFYKQAQNSGIEVPNSEFIISYPSEDDKRLVVSQSSSVPVFENRKITVMYPAILSKIQEDIAKFDWDALEKAFPECKGMTTTEAKKLMDNSFAEWDKYQTELKVNPNAKYLEYVVNTPTATPNINAGIMGGAVPNIGGVMPQIPNIGQPVMPQIPNVGQPVMPQMPNMGQPVMHQTPPVVPQQTMEQAAAPVAPAPTPAPEPTPVAPVPAPAPAPEVAPTPVAPTPAAPTDGQAAPNLNAVFENGGVAPTNPL